MIAKSVFAGLSLSIAAVVAAAPPAPAAEAPGGETAEPQPPNAQAATDQESERKICRTEKATGSLTRRTRICLTAAQWREVNDRTRRGVDEMGSSASGGKMCVPNPADPFQGCS